MRWLLPVVVLTGCFWKPERLTGDGGGPGSDGSVGDLDILTYGTYQGDWEVAGAWFTIRFAGGDDVFHFPRTILIDVPGGFDADLVGNNPDVRCGHENAVGVAFYPYYRIAAYSEAPDRRGDLVSLLEGPAVVKLQVNWFSSFSAEEVGAGTIVIRQAQGVSTFTMFPDGAIVREDTMAIAGAAVTTATASCDTSAAGYFPSSFTALALAAAAPRNDVYTGDGVPAPSPFMTPIHGEPSACMEYGDRRIALGWKESGATPLESRILRPQSANDDATIAFVRDFIATHPFEIPAEAAHGPVESAMFLHRGGEDCVASGVLARARSYALDAGPTLSIGTTGDRSAPAADGIYGGDGSPIAVAGSVTLTGDISTGFAVWLRFDGAVTEVTVDKPGASAPFHVPQRVNDREFVIWFPDPLTASQTITVTGT